MQVIKRYFPNLGQKQEKQFRRLLEIFPQWNEKINLVSRKDIENLEVRHLLHSLSIAKIIEFKPKTKALDVGTGGGFPGIPLAILFPEVEFVLIDSIGKKIKAVGEMIKELELDNVRTKKARSEEINEEFDFIIGRAVCPLDKFQKNVKELVKEQNFNALPNGIIYLGSLDNIADKKIKNQAKVYNIDNFFQEDYFNNRTLLYLKH